MAPGAEPALQPERVERERSRMTEPQVPAGRDQPVVEVGGELGRHVQLPAELPRVRDPERPRLRPAGLDPLRREERERLVREVFVGDPSEQVPRARSGHVHDAERARDVGDGRVRR